VSLHGEVRVVADPPATYAALVAELVRATQRAADRPFRLAVSGGSSGEASMRALVAQGLPWDRIELFFVDERCVPVDDPRSNAGALAPVLGEHRHELAGWHPMSCAEGPVAYEESIRAGHGGGALDVVQLGFGPDGHTASIFPGSPALDAAPGALVVINNDLTGRNPLERMTLTLEAIAGAQTVVVVVIGSEKRDALARLLDGEDLPAGRVRAARRLLWLIDESAVAGLEERLGLPRPGGPGPG
jgi:6-phosphogluconolactonase